MDKNCKRSAANNILATMITASRLFPTESECSNDCWVDLELEEKTQEQSDEGEDNKSLPCDSANAASQNATEATDGNSKALKEPTLQTTQAATPLQYWFSSGVNGKGACTQKLFTTLFRVEGWHNFCCTFFEYEWTLNECVFEGLLAFHIL